MSVSSHIGIKRYPGLFSKGRLGDLETPNRMLMCPMTRFRVDTKGVPLPANITYYEQRAEAGLIITESSHISWQGRGLPRSSGMHTPEQLAGWKCVVDAVHAKGGRISAQLSHVGRKTHPLLQPDGALPVAPSAIPNTKKMRIKEDEIAGPTYAEPVVPRPLERHEMPMVIGDYAKAAKNAFSVGFDMVELHSASANLPHQFLASCVNQRSDAYGGSAANRCRFLLETIEAMVAVRGPGRVGVKIAPTSGYNDIKSDLNEIVETYGYLLRSLNAFHLAYVHVQRPEAELVQGPPDFDPVAFIREHYKGNLVAAGFYDRHLGEHAIANGHCDFIAYGRRYIANPDLIERFRRDAGENGWDEAKLYAATAEGFTDYKTLAEMEALSFR